MAGVAGRWTRAAARARWLELGSIVRRPLLAALLLTSIWPCVAFALNLTAYRNPLLVGSMLAMSILVPLAACWRGPSGIGLPMSIVVMTLMMWASLVVGRDVTGVGRDGSHWIYSWGVAVMIVLAFARPLEEVALGTSGLVVANLLTLPAPVGIQRMHVLPMTLGGGVPAVVCALVLVSALRTHLRAARSARAAADAAEQQRAVAEAILRERTDHFARWEATAAPLLEDVATGRQQPDDPSLAADCAGLARVLRQELSRSSESMLEVLLRADFERVRRRGGSIVVNDHDVGYRLHREARIDLVALLRSLYAQETIGEIELTLVNGEADRAAAVLSVRGYELPSTTEWRDAVRLGTLTSESANHWWWDCELTCESAPALAYRAAGTAVRNPSSTAR